MDKHKSRKFLSFIIGVCALIGVFILGLFKAKDIVTWSNFVWGIVALVGTYITGNAIISVKHGEE